MNRAATETVFQNICSFIPGATFFIIFQEGIFVPRTEMNFQRGSICSSKRHEFSRRVYYVLQTDTNFPGGFSEKTCFCKKVISVCQQTLLSHRTDTNFPRNPYFNL